ncbi:bacteriohemerythrin [Zoogloea dura]|uniref:Bacteriohemerythrin n=1 Tax=Zoogloea dura TaxID=2728840 RepID=A0A848GH22_9RHOO|nr:bacteriohemerythrin [Zoogloea dura]NML28791.1 bacteriohemerythrin [Zoogloea dura]
MNIPLDALDLLDQGVAIFDAHHRLVYQNAPFVAMVAPGRTPFREGSGLALILDCLAAQGVGQGDDLRRRLSVLREALVAGDERQVELVGERGRHLFVVARATESGTLLLQVRDITLERRSTVKLESVMKVAVSTLADLAEYRDTDTSEHVLRVARLTHEIARELVGVGYPAEELSADFLSHLGTASMLHDIGKVGVPDSILLKKGKLEAEERAQIERHAEDGGSILKKASRLLPESLHFRLAAEIAFSHHERWDGKGYPSQLAGEQIPLSARITSVADVFDALSSERPYKPAWPLDKVEAYMRESAGTQFDPRVVAALGKVLEVRERASNIQWSALMSLNDPVVDHDHAVLLTLINQISLEANCHDPSAVEFVVDELVGYTLSHFGREERLLERNGYPHLDAHKKVHRRMAEEVIALRDKLRNNFTPALGEEISRYLRNWLTDHILVEDKKFARYLGG